MRMSPHVNTHHRHDVVADYIRRVGSGVKMLDTGWDMELVRVAKGHGGLVVGRLYEEHQELGAGGGRWIQRNLAWAREHPEMDYAEGYNEEFQGGQEMSRYADLELERMRAFDAAGLKTRCLIGCFSCGNPPNFDDWERFLPALRYAVAHGHGLALHEYSGPFMQWMAGANQWNHQAGGPYRIDDPCTAPGTDGFLTLRHRKVQRLLRERWGLTGLKLALTETGIDDVQPRPGPQGKGYKSYVGTDWERTVHGDYAAQLRWYGERLSEDPGVLFWCDFGFGQAGDWETFDLSNDDAMRERVIAGQLTLPRVGTAAPPPPPPPPEVTMIEGIDVARYQGTVDWRKAAAAGARFAWCKATEGTGWIDPRFHDNARGAAAAGILVGAYHYYRNELDPRAQAHHLAAVCAQHQLTLPPALDFEDTASPADPAAMRAFCEEVGRLMGRPVIYTASWWWTRSRLGGAQPWASAYPLWVADYDGAVALPGDWSDWTIHQFTSSGHGPTYGAESARIDRNRYRGTVEQLATLRQPVATELDVTALVAAAEAEHQERGVRFNPGAGIQRAILADGYVPTTNERDHDDASGHYVYQRAERLAGGEPRVYVWDPRAGAVRWVPGGVA